MSDRFVSSEHAFLAPNWREALTVTAVFGELVPAYRAAERLAERLRRGEER